MVKALSQERIKMSRRERVWHQSSCRGALGGCVCVLLPGAGAAEQAAPSSAPGACPHSAYFHLESQDGKGILCGLMYLFLQVV